MLPKLPASTLRTIHDFIATTAPELLVIYVQEPLLSMLPALCQHTPTSTCADPMHDHCYGCGIDMPHALDTARWLDVCARNESAEGYAFDPDYDLDSLDAEVDTPEN